MDRTYPRVQMGAGAFHHPPRAKYSEDTKNLIKLLMEESKVSTTRRKLIRDAVDRGESLPLPVERSSGEANKQDFGYKVPMPSPWKRRTRDTIIKSGAYEREQCTRTAPSPSKEEQKRRLACIMAYGKDVSETPRDSKVFHRAKREPRQSRNIDPIDDLVRGVEERMEFLSDMERLGMGKKYRPIIHQEIAHKLRLIESMDEQKSKEIRKEIRELEKPLPKSLPLGDLDNS